MCLEYEGIQKKTGYDLSERLLIIERLEMLEKC